jgi:hypothetical protein
LHDFQALPGHNRFIGVSNRFLKGQILVQHGAQVVAKGFLFLHGELYQRTYVFLNLPFIAQGYPAATQQAAQQQTAYSDFLEHLLRMEATGRTVRKQTLFTRLAGFPAIKTLEDFDYEFA